VAFDDAEKERIRYHMGYLQVSPAAGLTFGIPAPIQTMFLLESAMDRVIIPAEDRVRKLITTLDEIECRMLDAQNYLVADQLADITIRKNHIDQLEDEYCRWAARLADTLGSPLYPGAARFRRLFGTGGANMAGSIPVRS
jgi:hypothetical protein